MVSSSLYHSEFGLINIINIISLENEMDLYNVKRKDCINSLTPIPSVSRIPSTIPFNAILQGKLHRLEERKLLHIENLMDKWVDNNHQKKRQKKGLLEFSIPQKVEKERFLFFNTKSSNKDIMEPFFSLYQRLHYFTTTGICFHLFILYTS